MNADDYSMVKVGTPNEDCEITRFRFGMADLKGAVVKSVTKDEIVIELQNYRKGVLFHIHPGIGAGSFQYSTIEGGRA